jgi:hypothetical protein
MPHPVDDPLEAARQFLGGRRDAAQVLGAEFAQQPQPVGRAQLVDLGHEGTQRGVEVALHVQRARDVGPGEAQITR